MDKTKDAVLAEDPSANSVSSVLKLYNQFTEKFRGITPCTDHELLAFAHGFLAAWCMCQVPFNTFVNSNTGRLVVDELSDIISPTQARH